VKTSLHFGEQIEKQSCACEDVLDSIWYLEPSVGGQGKVSDDCARVPFAVGFRPFNVRLSGLESMR
jgi:hypothetical protein